MAVIIPWERLSEAALDGIIEEYVLREGTEYGLHEVSLEQKKEDVLRQLRSAEVEITFDDEGETCSIVPIV
jgi:hypothetical protein